MSLRDGLVALNSTDFLEAGGSKEDTFGEPDLTISSGGHTVFAHLQVLMNASPVFSHMMNSDMREQTEHNIEIPATCADVLDYFLDFLYFGELPSESESVLRLLLLAHQYDVRALICACVVSFLDWISLDCNGERGDNFGLTLAFDHEHGHLMDKLEIVLEDIAQQIRTDAKLHADLFNEAILRS